MVEIGDCYKKRYRLRAVGERGLNVVVSIPRVALGREAEKRGITIGDFLEQFKAVAQYGNFEGVVYTFEKITEEGQLPKHPANPIVEGIDGGEQ